MKVDFLVEQDPQPKEIPLALSLASQVADEAARDRVFADYQERRATETLRQQSRTLVMLQKWLAETAEDPGDLYRDPEAWRGITWGLVSGFIRYQLQQGYAISTTNNRLSTIKRYMGLALQAGTVDHREYALTRTIMGYSRREGRNLDQKRAEAGIKVRRGHKAQEPILLSPLQIKQLKTQPDTPQGRRDQLLMTILLDHGLRCSEVSRLSVANLDLARGELTFYRPKVDKQQIHQLSKDMVTIGRMYMEEDALSSGTLLRRSWKDGKLLDTGMSERAITLRVKVLGEVISS